MSYKELTSLTKKLFSLLMVAILSIGMLTVPVKVNAENTVNEIVDVQFIGAQDSYAFYEGVNDGYFIASGSMIRITYADGRGDTLKVKSGAFIQRENPKNMKLKSKNGKATIALSFNDEDNKVSFKYNVNHKESDGSETPYEYSQDLFTRSVSSVDTMPLLQKGTMSVNSEAATSKFYRINTENFIGSGDVAYFNSYTVGDVDTVLTLLQYVEKGEKGYWKEINYNDDDGQGYNANMFYKLERGQKYIIELKSFGRNVVLVTQLTNKETYMVTSVKDLGSVYYVPLSDGNLNVEYTLANGSKKTVRGLRDNGELNLYINGSDTVDSGYELRAKNTEFLANESILPIALKKENVIGYNDFSKVPAYQLGGTITIPANSFTVYSVVIPEYFKVKFDKYIEAEVAAQDGNTMWIEDYPEDDVNQKGKIYQAREEFINQTCLIGFANRSDEAITGRIIKADENGQGLQPQSVSLDKTAISLNVGNTAQLSATIAPAGVEDSSLTWTSSNASIAKVDAGGKVTAVAAGTAVITVKTVNGKTASCNVTVAANPAPQPQPQPQAPAAGSSVTVNNQTYKVNKDNTVSFKKSGNKSKEVVPDTVTISGKQYAVTSVEASAFSKSKAKTAVIGKNVSKIASKAFKGSKVKTLEVKSKKLKAKSVKGSLKGSKVTTVKVKVGKKKENKKYVKKYKKIFTKKNAGKKVTVK